MVQEALTQFIKFGQKITRDAIAAHLGVGDGVVSENYVWIKFKAHQKAQKQSQVREVPLSANMLAEIPSNIARSDQLAEIEEIAKQQDAEDAADNRGYNSRHKRRNKPS